MKDKVRDKFKDYFGGRERVIGVGGAAVPRPLLSFLSQCFNGLVQEGYGTTEVMVAIVTHTHLHCILHVCVCVCVCVWCVMVFLKPLLLFLINGVVFLLSYRMLVPLRIITYTHTHTLSVCIGYCIYIYSY